MSNFESIVQEIGTAAAKIISSSTTADSVSQPSIQPQVAEALRNELNEEKQGSNPSQPASLVNEEEGADVHDDDDRMNPFATSYNAPFGSSSVLSSVDSVHAEAGSVGCPSAIGSSVLTLNNDGEGGLSPDGSNAEPDSPVSLGEYECLELDSIPNYMAFKSSALSRRQRVRPTYPSSVGGELDGSVASITSDFSGSAMSVDSDRFVMNHSRPDELFPLPDSTQTSNWDGIGPLKVTGGRLTPPKQLMDLAYSYDLQRETEYNPFLKRVGDQHEQRNRDRDSLHQPAIHEDGRESTSLNTIGEEDLGLIAASIRTEDDIERA